MLSGMRTVVNGMQGSPCRAQVSDNLNLDSTLRVPQAAPMRILLLEDARHNAAYLKKGLAENGFAVDVAPQSQIGLDMARRADYDLLVLNAMLGLPLFVELRSSGKHTPVLFLDAPKSFAFSDFLSHVRSAVGHDSSALSICDLRIDLVSRRVVRGGLRLDLTPKEFLLLSLLVRRAGEVLSRAVLADQVWGINFDSNTNFVDVHIRRLRAKVDDPFDTKLIQTVRGVGYVLEER
jgi:two-component system copper resistance phosphate regulon response regulator CusR